MLSISLLVLNVLNQRLFNGMSFISFQHCRSAILSRVNIVLIGSAATSCVSVSQRAANSQPFTSSQAVQFDRPSRGTDLLC